MPPSRLAHAFRALRHRNFRLFVSGQLISLSGTWMQQVALGWLVYRLTSSPFLLGALAFAALFPVLALAPLGGVLADRLSRRRIVVVTQSVGLVQAAALATLALTDHVTVGALLALAALLGIANAADVPARQSFLVEMVEGTDDLPSAIALNSAVFNASRLVGPSIAGLLIAWIGEGTVFAINALSYVAVIAALLAMRLPPAAPRPAATTPVHRTLAEGLGYAFGFLPIQRLLLLLMLVSLVGYPYVSLLPVFARDILHGDARTLGFLLAASGCGAVTAVLLLATRPSARGLLRIIGGAVVVFALSLIGLALARRLLLSLLFAFVAGGAMMVHLAATNTLLQTIVEDAKRGRLMSLFAMSHMGTVPLGALLTGAVATKLGAPTTVALGGALCLLLAAAFVRSLPQIRAEIRPVYIRLGIVTAAPAPDH